MVNERWLRGVLAVSRFEIPGDLKDRLSSLEHWEHVELSRLAKTLQMSPDAAPDREQVAILLGLADAQGRETDGATAAGFCVTSLPPAAAYQSADERPASSLLVSRPSKVPGDRRLRISRHIFAGSAALCVEPTAIESNAEGEEGFIAPPQPTLLLEFAASLGNRRYDWANKRLFRLTEREMPVFASVVLGHLKQATFSNHGNAADKSLFIEDQGRVLFLRFKQGSTIIAVPVTAEDVYHLGLMCLSVLYEATGASPESVDISLRRLAQMLSGPR